MKHLLLVLLLSGCTIDPAIREFEEKRDELERDVELLRLQKRKLILEKQIDSLDGIEFVIEEKDEKEKE